MHHIMKTMLSSLSAALALLLGGCYSMDVASNDALKKSAPCAGDANPIEHVVISNYGWYLFNRVPLVCGNAKPGGVLPFSFFSDEVQDDILHDRFMAYAAAKNSDVKDFLFISDERVLFEVPGLSVPIPVPYVLCFREVQFSGVLTGRRTADGWDDRKRQKAVDEMNLLLDRLNPEETK